MSAPRSPTETKVVPAGGRPIVSTVSAQTADARVCGVTPLGGRAQIVWWARPSVAPEGSTARQLCAKNPVPRSLPTRPAPLERAMRREVEDRVVVHPQDDRMPRRRGVALRDMRVHHSLASDRPTIEEPVSGFGLSERAELSRQALVGGPGNRRHGAHEPVGASGIAKVSRPELGLGPMTGFIEHVRSLARPPRAAKSARDMRPLAHKRKMWVMVSPRGVRSIKSIPLMNAMNPAKTSKHAHLVTNRAFANHRSTRDNILRFE